MLNFVRGIAEIKVTNEKSVKMRQMTPGIYTRFTRAYLQRPIGFTLVELLVVISIIALLMAILMPALNTAQKKAMYAVCKSQFHQIGLATLMYAEENRYKLPAGNYFNFPNANHGDSSGNGIAYEKVDEGFIATDVQPYLGSSKVLSTDFSIFICPADKKTRESGAIFEGNTAQYGNANPQGATTEEWYKSGHLNFSNGLTYHSHSMCYYIYYYYFGNYPWELTCGKPTYEEAELLWLDEIDQRAKGIIFPKSSVGQRAKLMQDVVTGAQMDYFGLISSHEGYNPNGLFTDGSVEGLARSKLQPHWRITGLIFYHYW